MKAVMTNIAILDGEGDGIVGEIDSKRVTLALELQRNKLNVSVQNLVSFVHPGVSLANLLSSLE